MAQEDEPITFERMERVTREVLKIEEKAPGAWHMFCLVMLRITKTAHPEETEERILLFTELAILGYYFVQVPPEASAPNNQLGYEKTSP